MSDFGSEMGSGSVQIINKLMEALLRLVGKIFDTFEKNLSAEAKLKKQQLKDAKRNWKDIKQTEKFQNKSGVVSHNEMVKSGIQRECSAAKMSKEDIKELVKRCEIRGIKIAILKDTIEVDKNGKSFYAFEFFQKDAKELSKIIDEINADRRIKKINIEIEKLEAEKESLLKETDEIFNSDVIDETKENRLNEINDEIERINEKINELNGIVEEEEINLTNEINNSTENTIIDNYENYNPGKEMTFFEAVNKQTSRTIRANQEWYVVDGVNPDYYIKAVTKNAEYNNTAYIKTEFEIYDKNDNLVFSKDDGRFDGRDRDFWSNLRSELKDKGKFSDTVYKFTNINEVRRFKEYVASENKKEINSRVNMKYEGIIEDLKNKIKENGFTYSDTNKCAMDKDNNAVKIDKNLPIEEQANIVEVKICEKEINNYTELIEKEALISIAEVNIKTYDPASKEYAEEVENLENLKKEHKTLKNKEEQFIQKRKEINSIQAERGVRKTVVKYNEYKYEDKKQLNEIKTKIEIENRNLKNKYEKIKKEALKNSIGKEKKIKALNNEVAEIQSKIEDLKEELTNLEKDIKERILNEREVDEINEVDKEINNDSKDKSMNDYEKEIDNKKENSTNPKKEKQKNNSKER